MSEHTDFAGTDWSLIEDLVAKRVEQLDSDLRGMEASDLAFLFTDEIETVRVMRGVYVTMLIKIRQRLAVPFQALPA